MKHGSIIFDFQSKDIFPGTVMSPAIGQTEFQDCNYMLCISNFSY